MVRTVGIDPGEHAVKVVELDGSYRKTRLLHAHVAVPAAGERAAGIAAVVREALDAGMKGDVAMTHACREAVLRVIELPFKGHDAIRKVVKAEVEGEIHSHVVDDMVVDFHELGSTPEGGSRVLVASVPKAGVRQNIEALGGVGVEPESVDLDTMALWRVAHWAGAFEAPEGAVEVVGAAPSITAVVDLGARSVKVLLVEGDRLVEMRSLRLGDGAIADEVARRNGIDVAAAREAVLRCLATGADHTLDVEEAVPAPAEGAAAPAAPAPRRRVVVGHAEVEAAQTAFLQRLARELVRYLTSAGKASHVRCLWVTGGALRIPGMTDMLQEVFGVVPRELDVLGRLQHELSPDDARQLGPQLAVAIGAALARLGGPVGFELRQEDLVLSRGFERVKFPLAIACMVALLAVFVHGMKRLSELRNLEYEIGKTFIDPKDPKAPPMFYGMLNVLLAPKWFEKPTHFGIEQGKGKDYAYKDLVADLVALPVHKRVLLVRDKLKAVVDQKQKESGIYEDVSLESGLAVLVRWAQVMKAAEQQLGRHMIMRVAMNMKAPNRFLEFTVAFRGDDFRDRFEILEQVVAAEMGKVDSPFEPPNEKERGANKGTENPFKDAEKSGVRGAYYTVKLNVRDAFRPFGPLAAAEVK
jgi:Tfp pilus assembly PilM family ATPase